MTHANTQSADRGCRNINKFSSVNFGHTIRRTNARKLNEFNLQRNDMLRSSKDTKDIFGILERVAIAFQGTCAYCRRRVALLLRQRTHQIHAYLTLAHNFFSRNCRQIRGSSLTCERGDIAKLQLESETRVNVKCKYIFN